MKRLLSINASPRGGGSVERMLAEVESALAAEGVEVTRVDVDALGVAPCRGCMACRSQRRCVLPPDDAHRVATLLAETDGLLIGMPIYWANMPGGLKTLFDRLVYALMDEGMPPRPLHRGKRVAVVAACSTPEPWATLSRQKARALRSIREITRWSGYRRAGSVVWASPAKTQFPAAGLQKIARRLMKN